MGAKPLRKSALNSSTALEPRSLRLRLVMLLYSRHLRIAIPHAFRHTRDSALFLAILAMLFVAHCLASYSS